MYQPLHLIYQHSWPNSGQSSPWQQQKLIMPNVKSLLYTATVALNWGWEMNKSAYLCECPWCYYMSDGTTLNSPQSINGTHVAEQPTSYLFLVIYQCHTLLPTVPVFSTLLPFIKFLFLFSIHLWIFCILSSWLLFFFYYISLSFLFRFPPMSSSAVGLIPCCYARSIEH